MNKSKRILFLDVAGDMGIADGNYDEKIPRLSTYVLSKAGAKIEEKFGRAMAWAVRVVQDEEGRGDILAVFIEEAIMPRGRAAGTEKLLIGWWASIAAVFEYSFINVHTIPAKTIRAFVLGNGNIKKEEAKPEVLRVTRACGFNPANHNEGDAGTGWIYASSLYTKAEPPRHLWAPKQAKIEPASSALYP